MDKLKVGLLIDENSLPTEGGGYAYYQAIVKAIDTFAFDKEIEIVNIVFSENLTRKLYFNKPVILVKKSAVDAFRYTCIDVMYRLWFRTVRGRVNTWGESLHKSMASIRNKAAIKHLEKNKIDLVYYLKPEDHIMNYPMIITHWDIGHKSMYSFPEVAANGNFEKREAYYINILNKAFLILCESNTGASELLKYYRVNRDKIKVLPIFSGEVVHQKVSDEQQKQVLSHYNLSAKSFYIYPAQFWAHKNHYNLVYAFHALVKEPGNENLKLVLCGADKGNMLYIKELINELHLNDAILLPGFVSNSDLYTFYKNAVSLVMPTFLGPTNIPLIEAAQLGCPVVCSFLDGHKELLGESALYFDPSSAVNIKSCMNRILDTGFRKQLAASAYQHISKSCFHLDKSIHLLQQILLQVKPIRKAWGAGKNVLKFFAYANIGMFDL